MCVRYKLTTCLLYVLTSHSSFGQTISNLNYPSHVGRYTVFEATMNHDDSPYSSPWDNVILQAVFTTPSSATTTIDGFYYDVDTWKVRFAPTEIGTYSFNLLINGTTVGSGSMTSVEVGERGFVRQHATNSFRLVYEGDNSLFVGVGVTGAAEPNPDNPEALRNNTTIPGWWPNEAAGALFPWFLPDEANQTITGNHTMEEYFSNIVDGTSSDFTRISLLNASGWSLFEDSINATTENHYSVIKGQWLDELILAFRQRGVRIILDPVGDTPKPLDPTIGRMSYEGYFENSDVNAWPANERYYRYVVARYAAYVDMWELLNEGTYTDAWVSQMSQYIKSIDPYGHMVSASYVPASNPDIDFGGFHTYFTGADLSDPDLLSYDHVINLREDGGVCTPSTPCAKTSFNKPIVFGEAGHVTSADYSAGQTAISDEQIKTRTRIWTTFFAEAHSLFWAQHWNPSRSSSLGTFFDVELRDYFQSFHDFADFISSDVVIDQNVAISGGNGSGARVYGLRSSSELYLYLYNPQVSVGALVSSSNIVVTADIPISGSAEWFDPSSGSIVGSINLTAGTNQQIAVPSMNVDLALRLSNRDVTRPTAPAGLTSLNIATTSFDLSWAPSTDDNSVASYRIFLDGVAYAVSTGTTVSLSGLVDGNTYDVTVSAVDAAGNESPRSSSIQVTTGNVLAVEFLDFHGTQGKDGIQLQWKVLSEINHAYYGIEWSIDGKVFHQLHQLLPNEELSYSWTHTSPQQGINYYRLSAVDIYGTVEVFSTIVVQVDHMPLSFFPNPTTGVLNVRGSFNLPSKMIIKDLAGKNHKVDIQANRDGFATISLNALGNGTYILEIEGEIFRVLKKD